MADSYPTPPMDEILASIRRIITDDAPRLSEPARAAPPEPAADEADEDVLMLGEAEEAVAAPVAPEMPVPAPTATPEAAAASGLLSASTHEASQRALAMLSGLAIDPQAGANTLDGLVREMLRPMLKDWLDAHLPEIVERVVAREVARISGR